jgi:hypothetical protein
MLDLSIQGALLMMRMLTKQTMTAETLLRIAVRGQLSIPLLPLFLTMSICIPDGLYAYPTTSVPLRPPCDNRRSSSISQYSTILPTLLQPSWCLATTIAHIGIESHDPMAPSDGRQTSIFGRLGTRRLGTVISTISSIHWPSQESLERSLQISLG